MSEGRIKQLLFASLAINVLLIGGVAGAYVAGLRFERPAVMRGDDIGPRRGGFTRSLAPPLREKVRGELKGVWEETSALRTHAREAREEVARVATVDPYDAAAVSTALQRQREADAALQAAWHEAIARALAKLGPEERRTAVTALTRDRGRGMMRGMGPHHDGRPGDREPEQPKDEPRP